ncbi:MAG: Ig-like domain-containing protein [Bacteroidaceae bacterium]|nr:Ig-like domain-containing protein [Bacteroidaceae bacterium]
MKKLFLSLVALMVAGVQTAWSQGFRVYQSDGTELQFSLSTDSIVFDNGLDGDEVFGPFTPVNMCIAKTWYKSKTETVTFKSDGTTDYVKDAIFKFFPYQGNLVIYSTGGVPLTYIRVLDVTAEKMVVKPLGSNIISVWATTPQPNFVREIQLSDETLTMKSNDTKSLTVTVLPVDADNPEVSWESSNEEVAVVSMSGKVIANAEGICTITCRATDGSWVKAECSVRVRKADTMEYVDLGLPSGTLWATCNVGAEKPEDYGDYFAWGETAGYNSGKTNFSWSTYKYCKGSNSTMTKYCTNSSYGIVDNKTELEPEDDAATVNWGSGWQMPSLEQCEELINSSYTTMTWTTENGVYGRKITSKSNGNTIFFPAAGFRYDAIIYYSGSYGLIWSRSLSSLNTDYASYYILFDSRDISTSYANRFEGHSVRPVVKQ